MEGTPDADDEDYDDEDMHDAEGDGHTTDLVILKLIQQQFQAPQQGGRFRRKSVLPVDESVLTELARHKSLEELLKSKST